MHRLRAFPGRAGLGLLAIILAVASPRLATAQIAYTWSPTAAGSYAWDLSTNWTSSGGTYPQYSGDSAAFSGGLAGAQTVTWSSPISVTSITMTNNTAFGYNISGGGSTFPLTFAGTSPSLTVTGAGTANQTYSTPIALGANTSISQGAASGALSLTGGIDTASYTLSISGAGVTNLGSVSSSIPGGNVTYSGTNVAGLNAIGTINLGGGTFTASGTSSVQLNGAVLGALTLAGSGSFSTNATNGAAFSGVTTATTVNSNNTLDTFTNSTVGATLNIAKNLNPVLGINGVGLGSGSVFNGTTISPTGILYVGANTTVNASNFQSYGSGASNPSIAAGLFLAPDQAQYNGGTAGNTTQQYGGNGASFTNIGTSPLYFNGGSVTRIGTPSDDVALTTTLNLNGQNALVSNGLFINNGYVIDYSTSGTATVIASYNSTVKGAGTYGNSVVTINGGRFIAGNSIGSVSVISTIFGVGGTQQTGFEINDVTGPAGGSAPAGSANGTTTGGYSLNVVSPGHGSIIGKITWNATASSQLNIQLDGLIYPNLVGGTDTVGAINGINPQGASGTGPGSWDPTKPYVWAFVVWPASTVAPVGNHGWVATQTGAVSTPGPTPMTNAQLNATVMFDYTSSFSANNTVPAGATFSVAFGNGTGYYSSVTDPTNPAAQGEVDIIYTPPSSTPEPVTILALAAGGFGLVRVVRRKVRGKQMS